MSNETPQSSSPVKASYYFLNSGKKFDTETTDSTVFTHLFWAFAQIDPSSHEVDISTMNLPQFYKFTEIVHVKNKPLQFLLSIGGKNAAKTAFDSMTSKPENRKAFIDSSISVAREYGFNGLDLVSAKMTPQLSNAEAATEQFLIYPNLSLHRQYFSNCFSTTQEHPKGFSPFLYNNSPQCLIGIPTTP
ncbi:chitotriosidase-1-like [Raphanus sativus]|nr:chitotriosidase-1-like [Raphanus sativus]